MDGWVDGGADWRWFGGYIAMALNVGDGCLGGRRSSEGEIGGESCGCFGRVLHMVYKGFVWVCG